MIENKKLNPSECGRLGARALNSDIEKKRAASKKAALTRMAKDPDVFKKMGVQGALKNSKNKVES